MKTVWLEPGGVQALGVLLLAVALVTCARTGEVVSRSPASAAPPSSTEERVVSGGSPTVPTSSAVPELVPTQAPARETSADAGPVERRAVPSDAMTLPLPRFYASLAKLAEGRSEQHVRVAWFGDSHAAADFWPDAVRVTLQARFGMGGPGYVHVGQRIYRHSGATVERDGRWRVEPRAPASIRASGDGVYGLGGIRSAALDAKALTSVVLKPNVLKGVARWTLHYRLVGRGGAFSVGVDGATPAGVPLRREGTNVLSLAFEGKPDGQLVVGRFSGEPQLFGLVVEGSEPGVVIDTLGINGARIGTFLTWDDRSWGARLRERAPVLVVLAYGTNEVGDARAVWRYEEKYKKAIARARRALPEVECLILGPTERVRPDWTTHPRVREIEAVQRRAAEQLGCAFSSTVDIMGGEGTLKEWAFSAPALARKDRVHLTPAGYERIGSALAAQLLASYENWERQSRE